jgi:FtsZ-binding cell division protein ZapB
MAGNFSELDWPRPVGLHYLVDPPDLSVERDDDVPVVDPDWARRCAATAAASATAPAAVSSERSDDVPLMKEMSLQIERLEAELRSATQKAARHEGQAEAYKQKAEAHKLEAGALRQDVEALKQEAEALKEERTKYQEERAKYQLSLLLSQDATERYHAEAEVLKSNLARAKETLAEKLKALEDEQKKCTVCLEHPAHVVALPCGHRCFCTNAECSAHVSLCPLCRKPMTGTLRIY